MSRFGLRSHTDATPKEYDDDKHTTKSTTTTTPTEAAGTKTTNSTSPQTATATTTSKTSKAAHRRVSQKKKKKTSSSPSSSSSPTTTTQSKDDKNVEVTTTAALTPITTASTTAKTPISLMCRLPLTRLSGFIEKLQLTKHAKKQATKYLLQQKQLQQQEEDAKNTLFDSLKSTADDKEIETSPVPNTTKKSPRTTTTTATVVKCEKEQNTARSKSVKVVMDGAAFGEDKKEQEEDKEAIEQEDEEEDLQPQQHYHHHHHVHRKEIKEKKSINKNELQNVEDSIVDKLMCLYCDKKFISKKLQSKHVDKYHMYTRDRRSSGRNMNNGNQLDEQITLTTNTSRRHNQHHLHRHHHHQPQQQQQQTTYPSCNYCKKTTGVHNLATDEITTQNQLNSLFMHLIEYHADKYYACKMCLLRFPNNNKLQKHKQMLHATSTSTTTTTLPYQTQASHACDEDDNDDDTDSIVTTTTNSSMSSNNTSNNNSSCNNKEIILQMQQQTAVVATTTTKRSLRLLQQQHSLDNSNSTDTCSIPLSAEEPTILSRLGLAQNRLPTKRKSGMHLRREPIRTSVNPVTIILPDKLRSGRATCALSAAISSATTTATTTAAAAVATAITSTGGRLSQASNSSCGSGSGCGIGTTSASSATILQRTESPTRDNLFRMPTSYVIDDDFYKDVVNNVRHNLLYYLDGKLLDTTSGGSSNLSTTNTINNVVEQQLIVRSTLVSSPLVLNSSHLIGEDGEEDNTELHAASLLNAITAFPTLLTAEQYGADASAKLRRAHTKHSWKWKWDSVKKYKLINEGGKMVKKMKPLLGVRDLSKLDMWTQLSMRHKFEMQMQQQLKDTPNEARLERLRLNEQLNMILDKRLLPQISLEQNEQSIIKVEEAELVEEMSVRNQKYEMHMMMDENLLAVLKLSATCATRTMQVNVSPTQSRLVLSGEWARPRCYMCMLCGAKFDKLKSLEEHKMFRHPHIYCTHYEVVGRELLAKNLLRHLFLPKQALARYNANMHPNERNSNCENSLTAVEDESSDSLQSTTTIQTTNTPRQLGQIVSPTHSLQSCSSANSFTRQGLSPVTTPTTPTALRLPAKIFSNNNNNNNNNNNLNSSSDINSMRICSKCQRKCSGLMDLYRHMLDCSGDYIWTMVKKRKYRYYCGSKKRRPCNKHLRSELRKTPKHQQQQPPKTPDMSQKSSSNQPTPRQRPSDAESIKKMLENLPAKRVCKQIFPVDIKKKKINKKSSQQQFQRRKKLLGKHRSVFKSNGKRQTRATQQKIAQAGKMLSKTKCKKKKITKNVAVKMVRQSKRNLRLRNLHKQKEQQKSKEQQSKRFTPTLTAAVTPSTLPKKADSGEPRSRSLTPKQQQQEDMKQLEASDDRKTPVLKLLKNCDTNSLNITPINSNTTIVNTIAATTMATTSGTATTVASTMHEVFEYANSNASSTSTCTTNTLNSAASVPTITAGATNTRKRSKRISDCIAMLTGKLEEKLKTEQQPTTTMQTRSIAANTIVATSTTVQAANVNARPPATPTTTQQKDQQDPRPVDTATESQIVEQQYHENISQPSLILATSTAIKQTQPKTPKRKAQSRRILKPPSVENIVAHIEATPIAAKAVAKPPLISTVQPQLQGKSPTSTTLTTSTTPTFTLPLATSLSAHFVKPGTNIPVISLTAIPSLLDATQLNIGMLHKLAPHFPIVTMNNLGLLPQLPLPIASSTSNNMNKHNTSNNSHNHKNNTATTVTVAATATPLTSVDNKYVSKKVLPKITCTPTINLKLPLPLPLNTLPPTAMPSMQMNTSVAVPLLQSTNSHFEEPLNLSNAARNEKDSTYDTQRSTALISAAYRNNLYGIDMSQHMFHNEDIGPLDLSLKSQKKKSVTPLNANEFNATSITNIMPLALTVTTTGTTTINQPLALTVNSSQYGGIAATATTTLATSAAMFINECNKHFYSNLDLLKIPQVRSQLAAFATSSFGTATTTTTLANSNNSSTLPNTMQTSSLSTAASCNVFNNIDGNFIAATSGAVSGHMLQRATKATMVVAPIVKKRGNNRQQQQHMHDAFATTTTTNTGVMSTTTPTKHIIKLYPNAGGGRGKATLPLTMNEEIINHIDDAINSVINAVKASFTPERAEDEMEKAVLVTTATTITTMATATTIATIAPITTTTATILPNILTATTTNYLPVFSCSTITTSATQPPLVHIIPTKRRGRSKPIDHSLATPIMPLNVPTTDLATALATNIVTTTRSTLCLEEKLSETKPITTMVTPTKGAEALEEITKPTVATSDAIAITTTTTVTVAPTVMAIATLKEQDKEEDNDENLRLMKVSTNKELENISDEPQPAQKKFRRRRKNELAAIVADQLLESFKIDKARRDSLKKLENLAYEHKNEDLFMTGMLLMSSTKRSVTMNSTQKKPTIEVEPGTKRTSLRNRQTNTTTTTLADSDTTTSKRGRRAGISGRRPYRRRGKTLDNENIIKLKSSLESFSIGIERQLTEFEAKKEQQQKQERLNDGREERDVITNNNNNNATPTKLCTPSILRPSILSASIETTTIPLTTENVAKITSSLAQEQSRSAFACRDPRLNKNIHKGMEDDIVSKQLSQASKTPNVCDYEEEDNYLTEIAKNVNEKIMAAENEDFIFANDGLLELEDTSSQFYSRPPTAMSVRSAPNFDDRSDFGSMCGDDDDEEHTNTEVMDMDLDDEMSVYTSYSQDLGGRASSRRRRRRRRSILLTRRPKKRLQRNENVTEKFECTLCKKIFFSANSLSKHNMTLAHVSKVSEQEYLLSKAASLEQGVADVLSEFPSLPKPTTRRAKTPTPSTKRAKTPTPTSKSTFNISTTTNRGRKSQAKTLEDIPLNKTTSLLPDKEQEVNKKKINSSLTAPESAGLGTTNSHVALNSDERLFFECCTILKGAQDKEESTAHKHDDSNNFSPYQYHLSNKINAQTKKNELNMGKTNNTENNTRSSKKHTKTTTTFRDPPTDFKLDKNRMSPNYPGISQLSAVTNTSTFRIKTKAAMKGYENIDLTLQPDLMDNQKSRNSCKLTELADIALGNQQKVDCTTSRSRSNRHTQRRDSLLVGIDLPKATTESSTSSKTIMHSSILNAAVEEHNKTNGSSVVSNKIVIPERPFKNIGLEEKEPITFQKPRTSSLSLLKSTTDELLPTGTLIAVVNVPPENTLSSASFSDRDDFDFRSLSCDEEEEKQQHKPEVEEDSTNRGVKTPSNSHQHEVPNIPLGISNSSNDTSYSHNSDKTFENKSLIMGRIFKNNTTKVPAPKSNKRKSAGVPKDPLPAKADLNQLFDELRGDVKSKAVTTTTGTNTSPMVPITEYASPSLNVQHTINNNNELKNKIQSSAAPYLKIVPYDGAKINKHNATNEENTTSAKQKVTAAVKPKAKVGRKPKAKKVEEKTVKKTRKKDLKKLQNELGMSPKQIEELIDEGQRKSKRRCATAKKFVETWSSDEYEEFLSTKDVIALIEEKEKEEEEKRKRKSSTTNTAVNDANWHVEPQTQSQTKSSVKSSKDDSVVEIGVVKKQYVEQTDDSFMPIMEAQVDDQYDYVLPTRPPTPTIPTLIHTNHKENKKESKKRKLKELQLEQDVQAYEAQEMQEYETNEQKKIYMEINNKLQKNPELKKRSKSSESKKDGSGKKRKHKHQGHQIVAADPYALPTNYFNAQDMLQQQSLMHSINSPLVETTSVPAVTNYMQTNLESIVHVEKKHKSHKKKKDKEHKVHKEHKEHKEHKQHKEHKEHKEHKNAKRKISLDTLDNLSAHKSQKIAQIQDPEVCIVNTTTKKHRGRKRKSETKAKSKHSKHKRNKYYWSSSSSSRSSAIVSLDGSDQEGDENNVENSDVDDGKVRKPRRKNNHLNQEDDEEDEYAGRDFVHHGSNGCPLNRESGEHLQKHGWIVGDSHKKVVTLLAIAKGSKTSEKKRKNSKKKGVK